MGHTKKILIGSAAVLAIVVGIGIIHHYRVKGAVERYKAELRAQGELLTIEECLPPRVTAANNGAELFLSVTTNFVYDGPLATNAYGTRLVIAPGIAMVGWAQPWFGEGKVGWFSNSWAEALADLEMRRDEGAQLAKAAGRPALQFESDYTNAWFDAMSLMHFVSGLKQATRLLSAESQCELHQGNSEAAARYLQAELAIIDGTTDDRWLITQLVRAAITGISMSSTWDLLHSKTISEQDLGALQNKWKSLAFLEALEDSFGMERAMTLHTIEQMRGSRKRFDTVSSNLFSPRPLRGRTEVETPFHGLRKAWGKVKLNTAYVMWRFWWSYTDEKKFLLQSQHGLDLCRLAIEDGHGVRSFEIHQAREANASKGEQDMIWGGRGFSGLRNCFQVTWFRAFEKLIKATSMARLTATAIALDRHRLRRGAYPDRLDELVPELLAGLPIDPMDGKPLRYHPLEDGGFVLYSVGDNQRDDGGDPNRIDEKPFLSQPPSGYYEVRDWVWPQHASEEQVLAYWKKEVGENYVRLFVPDDESDPYTEVPYEALAPMINPTTGKPMRHPETGRVMFTLDGESKAKELEGRIESLARQWTEQYFRTLTNRVSSATEAGN